MKLLAIHPNYELYGSDRSFAGALTAIVDNFPEIDVSALLPREGPILQLAIFDRIKVHIRRFWIPRRGDLPIHRLPLFFLRGITSISRALKTIRGYDIIYIDTIICLDFIIAARMFRGISIVHVREIPTGNEMKVFRSLLLFSKAVLIFNSGATRDAFHLPNDRRSYVVYNGTEVPRESPKQFYAGERPLRVMVIGRLNHWKGQEILVEAVARMPSETRDQLEVHIVGGVYGEMDHFRERLDARIKGLGLEETIRMCPFTDNPTSAYRWADIVVVPSTSPEPFGRVAIEGMSFACTIVASAHGGLTEIVVDGLTGKLVPPSNPDQLAVVLANYVREPELVQAHGEAGLARFHALFTNEKSSEQMVRTLSAVTEAM